MFESLSDKLQDIITKTSGQKELTQENMQDAQIGLTKKHTFIGALEFLNSQASVSLIQKRGKNFNAIA